MSAPSNANDDGLFQTPPADSALSDGIDRRSLMQNAAIGAAVVMTGALTPEANAQAPKETKIVLTGIARSKGKAAGEAMVNRQRMGWAFNHVGNEDGIVLGHVTRLTRDLGDDRLGRWCSSTRRGTRHV